MNPPDPMSTTALIAEDEPLLASWLQNELASLWPALEIVARVGDGAAAVERALALRPQLLFLDVRMPGMTGLEAAQALAEDWPAEVPFPLLVFCTAYEQYAVQAFESQAADYLVKPVDTPRLAACVARLQTRLAERAPRPSSDSLAQAVAQVRALLGATPAAPVARLEVVQAQVGSTVHMVPVDEVIYFEAADKYVRVVTAAREHLIRMPLKDLLPQLDPQKFWQVHRGTLVQARYITQARRDESGKVFLSLRERPETLTASRLYAHLFKGM